MKLPLILRIYLWVFVVLFSAFTVYLVFFSDFKKVLFQDVSASVLDFTEEWHDPRGNLVDIDEVTVGHYGAGVTFKKMLPQDLKVNDELCFISSNSNVQVFIGDKLSYEYRSEENITGMGYGRAYHTVNMGPEDSGMEVRMLLTPVFEHMKGGRLASIYICEAPAFRSFCLRKQLIPFILSTFITISGLLIIILRFGIPKNMKLPYNLVALGVALTLAGIWLTGDTGVLQMIFGHVTFWRSIEYLLMLFALPPTVSFILSFMIWQRGLYVHLTFLVPYLTIAFLLFTRFVLGIGMDRFGKLIYVVYSFTLLLVIVIIADNAIYCKKQNITLKLGFFYISIGSLAIGVIADIVVVAMAYGKYIIPSRGSFMRIGISILVVLMLVRITMWWSGEQSSIARDRFVNKILQYSLASSDAETKINLVLEYLGSQLHSDRAYIFEDVGNYKFDNTYEWCAKGVSREIDNLKGLPYDGVVDAWYEEYKRNNVVLIYDLEQYKSISENMYNVLKPQGIRTLITAPLMAGGKFIGFFGVDNPPADTMNEIREILLLLTYFISQLVLEKQYEHKLVYYSYFDALTGVRNRRAISEFEKEEFDPSKPYGFIMCDINGLKAMNDTQGHEAGDTLLKGVADVLARVFGNTNVYRVGGDEFAIYDCGGDKQTFMVRVEDIRRQLAAAGHSVSIGSVFKETGEKDYEKVKTYVDSLMYEEKKRYYEGRRDRRHDY
ncbi:MAG: diguanylate cyclase [Lachnospiraceae bacterium]|nr:diguanylate cyclase [Lachnospiraceae bacterium]